MRIKAMKHRDVEGLAIELFEADQPGAVWGAVDQIERNEYMLEAGAAGAVADIIAHLDPEDGSLFNAKHIVRELRSRGYRIVGRVCGYGG
jgi:hypothetical protein